MLQKSELRIRDPFIYADKETGWYYMYGTTSLHENLLSAKNTFSVYKTRDLENFDDGKVIVDTIINVSYGCNIVEVAKNVQEKVYNVVQTATGLDNISANVHVSGVAFEK